MLLRVQCLLVYHTLLGSRVHQLGWLHSDLEFAPVRMRQNIAASGNTITVTALWRVLGIDRLEESRSFGDTHAPATVPLVVHHVSLRFRVFLSQCFIFPPKWVGWGGPTELAPPSECSGGGGPIPP